MGYLSPYVVWEARPAGSAWHAGLFDPTLGGTDYSQQDLPQAVYTDLAIDGSNTRLLTSAGRPFVSADVGNGLRIYAGTNFTQGPYLIESVSAGAATVDRAVGTAGSTAGKAALGGGTTLQFAAANCTSGNTVWVQGGTHALTGSIGSSFNAVIRWPVRVLGYGSTRGDNGRPLLQVSTWVNGIDLLALGGNYWIIKNFDIDSKGQVRSGVFPGSNSQWENVHVRRASTGGWFLACRGNIYRNCSARECTGAGWALNTNYTNPNHSVLYSCVASGNVGPGFQGGDCGYHFRHCFSLRNRVNRGTVSTTAGSGHGWHSLGEGGFDLVGCVAWRNDGSGYRLDNRDRGVTSYDLQSVGAVNCIFAENLGFGLEDATTLKELRHYGWTALFRNNAFYQNGKGATSGVATSGAITLTADPFVDAPAGNFSLNQAAGGGALLRQAGWAELQGLPSTTHIEDVGATKNS